MYVMQDTHSVELGLIIAFVEFFFLTTNTKFKHMVSLDFFFTDYYTLSSVTVCRLHYWMWISVVHPFPGSWA